MLKLLATAVVVLSTFLVIASAPVLGLFTSAAAVPDNAFTLGTVELTASPVSAAISFNGMAPGDRVTAPITVSNAGTLDLRYAITSATDEDTLAGQLDLTVKSGVAECTDAGFGASGTVLYGPGPLGSVATLNLVGDPAQGAQAGDRELASGNSEALCFNVSLPLSTGDSFQGLSTTATFSFQAEQTRNN